ncbi:NADH dehydrogenase [Xanthomonas oryzae pv. oryzicola]|nr:NADH dehydrogenase [Xanthomonas oryzae pv. oryzicola]
MLLATGATHAYFGNDQWAEHAPGLKTLYDALVLRRKLLLAFERAEAESDPAARAAWLSFAVVGGGPTGVELAGTLAEIARHTLKNEFRHIDPQQARVRLVEAGPRVLPSFPEDLTDKARKQLQRLGVEVHTGTPVTHIDAVGDQLGDTFVPARTVVWAAGVAASPLARTLDVPLDRAGRVLVEADLSVPGPPGNFRRRRSGVSAAGRPPGAGRGTGRQTDGQAHRRGDPGAASRPDRAGVPLPGLRQPGHDRPHGRHRACGQAQAVRHRRLVVLASCARVLFDRLPQSVRGTGELGDGVLELPARRAHHLRRRHRRPSTQQQGRMTAAQAVRDAVRPESMA